MRLLRQLVGLTWIGVFIWGVVALVRGAWAELVVAVVIWFILGAIFVSIHNATQRGAVVAVQRTMSEVAEAVEFGSWGEALLYSQDAVRLATSSAERARSIGESGTKTKEAVLLGLTLIGHGVVLGANGRMAEARAALDRGLPLVRPLAADVPDMGGHLRIAESLRHEGVTVVEFRQAARDFHSFV